MALAPLCGSQGTTVDKVAAASSSTRPRNSRQSWTSGVYCPWSQAAAGHNSVMTSKVICL